MFDYQATERQWQSRSNAVEAAWLAAGRPFYTDDQREALVNAKTSALEGLCEALTKARSAREDLFSVARNSQGVGITPRATSAVLLCDEIIVSLTMRVTQLRLDIAALGGTLPSHLER